MILILIALIALTAMAVWSTNQGWSFFSDVVGPIFSIIGFFGLIAYCFVGFNYFAAEHQAKIINREYQTNYTQTEVFYASDVIDTMKQINRERIELNGNIMSNH